MSDLRNEILFNSGLNEDTEVLEEGIVLFKNSKKIGRLGKALVKKADKLAKKGKTDEANELFRFAKETNRIANKFKVLEDQYSVFGSKDTKQEIKSEYDNVSKEFSGLLEIAKQESFKRAAAAAKGLAIVAAVLFAGGTLLAFMETGSGAVTGAGTNLSARAANAVTSTSSTDTGLDIAKRAGERLTNNAIVRSTNKDLVRTALAGGATVGGVVGTGALGKLKKSGIQNKTITDTVRTIEDLKKSENQRYTGSENEEQD